MSFGGAGRHHQVATRTVSLAVRGPITRAGLPAVTQRCCAFFAANAGCRVDCDVGGCVADAVTVDALARLQLVAQKNRCIVVLRNAAADLVELVDLMGLADVLAVEPQR
jgi:ABC-type transporter Mla MlaB component